MSRKPPSAANASPDAARRGAAALAPAAAAGLLLALVLLWGSNWPIMKVGITLIPPFWFAVVRLGLGALTLFLLLAALGRLRLPPRADLPVVASVGLLQMASYLALVNLALESVPAGRSAVLAYTTPFWVAPGAALLLGERLTARRLLGLCLGLGGLLVLFNPLDFPWHDGEAVSGNLLLLVAAFAWALTILSVRGHRWRSSALTLLPWQLLLGSLALLPFAWWREGLPQPVWGWELAAILAYNGPFATGLAYWVSLSLTRGLPAVTVSLGFLGVPAVGLSASVLVLGEPLPWSLLAGLVLVLAGLVAVSLPARPPAAARGRLS